MRLAGAPTAHPVPLRGHAGSAQRSRTTPRGGATWTCRGSPSTAPSCDGRTLAFARTTPPPTTFHRAPTGPRLRGGALRAHAAERHAGGIPEAPAAARRTVPAAHSGDGHTSADHGGWGGGGFAAFADARAYARLLRLGSEQQWRQRCAAGMPVSVPSRPDAVYANSGCARAPLSLRHAPTHAPYTPCSRARDPDRRAELSPSVTCATPT